LTLERILAVAALVVAALAVVGVRRIARRLDRMTDSYWELRYDYGQLRARITRLEGGEDPEAAPPASGTASGSFIPLSSIKR
jgi:hypothetical protein